MRRSFLILSDSLTADALLRPPYFLQAEDFLLTGYDALAYIGFRNFAQIVLHAPSLTDLQKVGLGLADSPRLEALSLLLTAGNPRRTLVLGSPETPLPQVYRDLDLQPIVPGDLAGSARPGTSADEPNPGSGFKAGRTMTADDVRDAHQQGVSTIDPTWRLTPWAREVADSLGLAQGTPPRTFRLYQVPARTRAYLEAAREALHTAAHAHPDLLFVLAPPLLPLFGELFPSLRHRTVASTCCWAAQGAFTGETSLPMLQDLGCAGAVIPPTPPHQEQAHLQELIGRARRSGLLLFLQNPLAAEGMECDRMAAPGTGPRTGWVIPTTDPPTGSPADSGLEPAIFITDLRMLERKTHHD